jgi:hypothetical protein
LASSPVTKADRLIITLAQPPVISRIRWKDR